MWTEPGQELKLSDSESSDLGTVLVDRVDEHRVFGRFVPGQGFELVRQLFADWISCANDLLLADLERLDSDLAKSGLRVRRPDGVETVVEDCQPGEGRMSLRIGQSVALNGALPSTV